MITKDMYDKTCFIFGGEVDYMEIFRCILLTPFTVMLDIITSPFQIIAIIIGKIIESEYK